MLVTSVRATPPPAAGLPPLPLRPPSNGLAAAAMPDSLRLTVSKGNLRPASGGSGTIIPIPHRYQGEDASCGPSSLWMVLGHHLGPDKVSFTKLDRSMRPTGRLNNSVGTTPTALAAAARRQGLAASVTNHADTGHLRRMIDQGLPSIILGTWTDGVENDLHFIVVNGYEGKDDKTTTWHVTDPYVPGDGKATYTTQELMAFWQCEKVMGVRYPYQRAVVNVAPAARAKDLPADNRTVAIRVMDRALIAGTHVLRAFDNR
jgi:hypothetical protein